MSSAPLPQAAKRDAPAEIAAAENVKREATQAFRDAADCRFYRDVAWQVANPAISAALDPAALVHLSDEEKAARLAEVDRLRRDMDRAKSLDEKCAGQPEPPRDTHLYALTWSAAEAGDPGAIACYLAGQYPVDTVLLSEDETRRYFANFHALAQREVEKGNVFAVQQLVQVNQYTVGGVDPNRPGTIVSQGLLRTISVRDVAESYKYLLLLQRIAGTRFDPESAQALAFKRRKLDPQQQRQAQSWANATYEKSFRDQRDVDLDKVEGCR